MNVLTIASQKGGTGKTTTAAAIAQAAASARRSVLAIDLDPQGNLSFMLAADQTQPGAYSLITGAPADQLIGHIVAQLAADACHKNLHALTPSSHGKRSAG